MPFVEGDSTQVARPVRPVSLTGAVADLDARQRQDDRALVPRVASVGSSSSSTGTRSLGDASPGASLSYDWTPPGSGDRAVTVTLEATSNTYTGNAALSLGSTRWPAFAWTNSAPRAQTAFAIVPAGTPITITATNDPASTGPVSFAIAFAAT